MSGQAAQRPAGAPPGWGEAATTWVAVVCVHGRVPGAAALLRAALAAQELPPDQPVDLRVVDVRIGGGGPGAPRSAGPSAQVEVPAGTRLAVAVAAGLGRLGGPPAEGYLWLLDDSAVPAPDALRTLLAYARLDPGAAVIGPKLRAGQSAPARSGGAGSLVAAPPVVLEAGISVDRAGRRRTGIRPGEVDLGQHDGARDVLAVACAGMLVRAAAWHRLDGLDPELDAGHDIDLGWRAARAGLRTVVVPTAVMTSLTCFGGGATADLAAWPQRVAALRIRLAHPAWPLLPVAVLALVLGSGPRALGLLLRGRLRAAASELALPWAVLSRPRQLVALRRRAATTRAVPARVVRGLFPRGRSRTRRGDLPATATARPAAPRPPAVIPTPRTPADGEGDAERGADGHDARPVVNGGRPRPAPAVPPGPGSARAAATLTALLALVGVVAMRGMPVDGLGAGLPLPADVHQLWVAVWSGRVAEPAGPLAGAGPVPPATALLAAVASALGGRVAAAVWLLLALGPALAGLSAYRTLGRLRPRPVVRFGLAAAYGLSPALSGAVVAGRADTVAALIILPAVLRAGGTVLAGSPAGPASRARAVWALAVGLVGLGTCAPSMTPLSWCALAAGALLVGRRRWWDVLAVLPATLLPILLVLPAGMRAEPAIALAHLPQASLPLLAGAGQRPKAALVGLLAGCLICWLIGRAGRAGGAAPARRAARLGWSLALLGLVAVLVMPQVAADAGERVPGAEAWWAGPQYGLVIAGALLAAAAVAPRSRSRRFAALPVTLLVVVGPAALGADRIMAGSSWQGSPTSWGRSSVVAAADAGSAGGVSAEAGGAGDPDADPPVASLAPWSATGSSAVARAVLARTRTEPPGSSVLVLYRAGRSGPVRYTLATGDGARYPAGLLRPPGPAASFLTAVATDLAAGGDRAAGWLPLLGAVAVGVPATSDSADLAERLAASPSLIQEHTRAGLWLWHPSTSPGRRPTPATVSPPAPAAGPASGRPAAFLIGASSPSAAGQSPGAVGLPAAPASVRALPADGRLANVSVAGPRGGRDLVLPVPAGIGWQAWLDGRPLPAFRAWGWAAGFHLPPGGGSIRLARADGRAHDRVLAQAGGLGLLLLAGVPVAMSWRRSRRDADSPDADSPDADSPDADSPGTDSPDADSPDADSPGTVGVADGRADAADPALMSAGRTP
ncbi:glycosyltransferase [Frankia sp. AgB32]|uniref:glycosyltransferase n=1 Tax=Frankia sp. AgB32 TaxID=631119 RepID=UPI0020106DC8|nr:glycosyltransferase [Frankia sp. AgB32]MCK9893802.1 glycosyltransferase [Frankia sp. AgB32]